MNAFPVSVTCYTFIFRRFRSAFSYRSLSVFLSHKVFLWSIHWVQSPHQLVFNFLASIPVPLCFASYETRSCVYLYVLPRLFLLSISRVVTAFSSFSLCFSFLLPTLSSSVLFLLISSLSSTQLYHRAAFIPANTFSLSPFCHIPDLQSRYVHICRSRNRIVLFVHIFTTERNEENNVYRYTLRLGYGVSSNQGISYSGHFSSTTETAERDVED